jgi:3-oxoacyl-[acyl-carrier-protein] synthase-3
MNGGEIFEFTLRCVPACVNALLDKARLGAEQVDRFVFHQANAYMLEHLRKKTAIPKARFVTAFEDVGNTVSCTIPIALRVAAARGELTPGQRVMLVGFGVGYSWGATLVRWG